MSPTLAPQTIHHVLVDYENIHDIHLPLLGMTSVRLTLLLGFGNTKLDVVVVEKLLQHAATVEIVRLASGGNNAVDFLVAYHLGRSVVNHPTGKFYIISKDKGFDPLVEHLRSRAIRATRHDDFRTLPFLLPPKAPRPIIEKTAAPAKQDQSDLLGRGLEKLQKINHPPKTRKALSNALNSWLKPSNEQEIGGLIENLCRLGKITINEAHGVTYKL